MSNSDKRARRDRRNRSQAIARLHRKLKKSRKPAGVVNRGYAHVLEFPADDRIRINSDRVAEAARWDGLRAISLPTTTNIFKLGSCWQLLAQYRQLWQTGHGFRTNKHDQLIRSNYHWMPRKIERTLRSAIWRFAERSAPPSPVAGCWDIR